MTRYDDSVVSLGSRVGIGAAQGADYYTIIYEGTRHGIPTILIEHAYLSNVSDFINYLSSPDKLDALATADAAGILAVIQ